MEWHLWPPISVLHTVSVCLRIKFKNGISKKIEAKLNGADFIGGIAFKEYRVRSRTDIEFELRQRFLRWLGAA